MYLRCCLCCVFCASDCPRLFSPVDSTSHITSQVTRSFVVACVPFDAVARSQSQSKSKSKTHQALSLFGDAAVCNFPADEQVEVEGVATDGTTVKVRNVVVVCVMGAT